MNRSFRTALAASAVVVISAACATITPVAYSPQPARIKNPSEEVKTLILANTVQGCVSEPEVTDAMLVVKFVCSGDYGGVGNQVVRFGSVDSITLDQAGEWYRVLLKHRGGAEDFFWSSKSLEDMQRLADALTALSQPSSAAEAPAAAAAPAAI